MLQVVLWLWQLPQNIVGLTYLLVVRAHRLTRWGGTSFYRHRLRTGSVSLGDYIFLSPGASRHTMLHEYGHHRQSLLLGPLYLVVVGLPSLTWAAMRSAGLFRGKSYYSFCVEKWANELGGVELASEGNTLLGL